MERGTTKREKEESCDARELKEGVIRGAHDELGHQGVGRTDALAKKSFA